MASKVPPDCLIDPCKGDVLSSSSTRPKPDDLVSMTSRPTPRPTQVSTQGQQLKHTNALEVHENTNKALFDHLLELFQQGQFYIHFDNNHKMIYPIKIIIKSDKVIQVTNIPSLSENKFQGFSNLNWREKVKKVEYLQYKGKKIQLDWKKDYELFEHVVESCKDDINQSCLIILNEKKQKTNNKIYEPDAFKQRRVVELDEDGKKNINSNEFSEAMKKHYFYDEDENKIFVYNIKISNLRGNNVYLETNDITNRFSEDAIKKTYRTLEECLQRNNIDKNNLKFHGKKRLLDRYIDTMFFNNFYYDITSNKNSGSGRGRGRGRGKGLQMETIPNSNANTSNLNSNAIKFGGSSSSSSSSSSRVGDNKKRKRADLSNNWIKPSNLSVSSSSSSSSSRVGGRGGGRVRQLRGKIYSTNGSYSALQKEKAYGFTF